MMAEEIRKTVSDLLIRGELKDPGFQGMIGINAVEVTSDLGFATLYFTAIASDGKELTEEQKAGILASFNKSRGHLRSELAKRIKARHTPELIFKPDTSYEYGIKMDRLLDSLQIEKEEQNG